MMFSKTKYNINICRLIHCLVSYKFLSDWRFAGQTNDSFRVAEVEGVGELESFFKALLARQNINPLKQNNKLIKTALFKIDHVFYSTLATSSIIL